MRSCDRAFDLRALSRPTLVGFGAAVLRRILEVGHSTPVPTLERDAALVVFMLLFGCRVSTITGLRDSDLEVADWQKTVLLMHRKGKLTQDPLVLTYDRNTAVDLPVPPRALLRRWSYMRPSGVLFALAEEDGLSASAATYAVTALMSALSSSAPAGCAYLSHSARI
jgi:hypothetical protein